MEQDRQMAIDLIEEAVIAGARRFKACEVLEIDVRTLQRWNKTLAEEKRLVDQRKAAASERTPTNKLSDEEREAILSVCSKPEFQSLPPSQIVPRLADTRTSRSKALRRHANGCMALCSGTTMNIATVLFAT